ncbi:MAG: hypothetical protein IKZ51_07500 [Bacteroidales bacterium]|nr:hypothetical protein [Bacteroidales bacterium]
MYSDLSDYYLHWYHERPMAVTQQRRDELRRVHRCLMACINHFVQHYESLTARYMPLSDKELEILDEQCRIMPFRAGTFRPDYIITDTGELRLCEITSRFFAHGIFMGWFGDQYAKSYCKAHGLPEPESRFSEMMDYMLEITGGARRMFVFKSSDRTSEIRLYKRFYEAHGIEVKVLEAAEVEPARKEWDRPGTFLVSALNQKDILALQMDTLRAMMRLGCYSDFRNIFLIHDKRFMHMWFEDSFTGGCLSPEDAAFLRAHAIPTYLTPPADARGNKDAYILKPWRLGKSEGVHAGPLTPAADWEQLFLSGAADGMIAQPFLRQRTCRTEFEGTPFDDYACGMMLCVDDKYFDSGYFRCSSIPVTNQGDDRKAAVIHTDDPATLKLCDLL